MQTRIIDIPLYGGVDTKTEDKSVPTNKSLLLENAVMKKTREISKRNGYEELAKSTIAPTNTYGANDILSGNSIHSYNDLLVLIGNNTDTDETSLFNGPGMWVKTNSKDTWVRTGNYIPITYDINLVTSSSDEHIPSSVSYGSNQYLVTYNDGTTARQDILDANTNKIFRERVVVDANADSPKSVYITDGYGSKFMSMSNRNTAIEMEGVIIDPDNPTSQGTVWNADVANTAGNGLWDMGKILYPAHSNDGSDVDAYSEAIVTYESDAGDIRVRTFDSQANVHHSIILSATPVNCLSIYVRNNSSDVTERIYIMYEDTATNEVRCDVLDPNLTIILEGQLLHDAGTYPIRNITMSKSRSDGTSNGIDINRVFVEESYSGRADRHKVTTREVNYDGVGQSGTRSIHHVGLASKAFDYNGRSFVLTKHDTVVQPTYFMVSVMEATDIVTCAKIFYGEAADISTKPGLSEVIKLNSSQFVMAIGKSSRILSDSAREYQSALVTFEMNPKSLQSAKIGTDCVIGGGIITGYDGMSQEHGFHLHPENIELGTSLSTTGAMSDGYRVYKAVYTWSDRNGQRHRSAPSEGIGKTYSAGTSTQNQPVNLGYLSQQDYNNKSGGGTGTAKIEIYRTTDAGSIFYLVTSARMPNFPALDEVTVGGAGDESDIEIANNEILYTTGGELDNIAPPASNILTSSKDRIFLVPMDNIDLVWFSKQKVNGIGLEFSDSLVLRVGSGTPNKGLATIDDKVVIFKEREIYFVAGDGPNGLGQGSFSSPRRISTDVGCVDPSSVVNIGEGIMFKSHKGIYMLNRSLQATYIGAPVEEWNKYKVISASLMEDKNQVRFVLEHGKGILNYDYYHNMWARFTNHPAKDSAVHDGTYYWLKSSGSVRKENDGFKDINFTIPIKVRTGWIKLSGMQGYQRVRKANIIGDYKSPHTLTVKIYYDYDDINVGQTTTFTSSSAMSGNEPLQYQVHIAKQKCQAIMFEIYDNSTDKTLEGCSLTSIALEAGVKKGTNKLPPRKRD